MDLLPAWLVFSKSQADRFFQAYGAADAMRRRGRAWALNVCAVAFPYYVGKNAQIEAWARQGLRRVLQDWELGA